MLADEKERLRVTWNSIGDAVICTDAATCITFMNPVAEKLTGARRERGARHAARRGLCAGRRGKRREDRHRGGALRSSGSASSTTTARCCRRKDGSRCSIREVVSPILNEKGEFSGSVIVFQDFTDARTLQRRLAHAAAHDSLTGLANRASLLAAMSEPDRRRPRQKHERSFPLCRSRQLQDGQRHRRPRGRRPAAQAGGGDDQGKRTRAGDFVGAARRRRVRRHPRGTARPRPAKISPARSSLRSASSGSSMTARPSDRRQHRHDGDRLRRCCGRRNHGARRPCLLRAKASGRGKVAVFDSSERARGHTEPGIAARAS